MPASTHPPRRVRSPWATPVVALVASLGLLLPLSACTSDGPSPEEPEQPAGTAPAQTLRSSEVDLQTRVTRVAGRLPEKRRTQVAARVGRVLDAHLAAAYLRDYPVKGPGAAFVEFTPGARKQARRDQRLLTGRGLKGAQSVSVTDAAAYVALLAPRRHLVGATARLEVDLRVETEAGAQRVRVRGRVMLTPTPKGWRVFGYDLTRSDLAGKKPPSEKASKKKQGQKQGQKQGKKKSGGSS